MEYSGGQPSSGSGKAIIYSRVVDLSQVIHPGIPLWPGDPPVEFQTVARIDRDGYFLRRFCMGEHSGTHMNAPSSFYPNGASIDAYPDESLVAPAIVVDIRRQVAASPDYALRCDDVTAWEARHGRVPEGSIVLLHTGWQEKWGQGPGFFGLKGDGGLHFPGFGYDAARLLLVERKAGGLGTDTHGLEPGQDSTFAVNRLALERPRVVLENLTNLDCLPPTGVTLVIGRLRLAGGSGSPVSVLAFVP